MKKSILQLGTTLSKKQQANIKGGIACHHVTADFEIQVTESTYGHKLYVDGVFQGYLSGNIEAHNYCSTAAAIEANEWGR